MRALDHGGSSCFGNRDQVGTDVTADWDLLDICYSRLFLVFGSIFCLLLSELVSRKMLSSVFYNYGLFCTAHAWEAIVLIVTLTLSVTSLTFFGESTVSRICGWNFHCADQEVGLECKFFLRLLMASCNISYDCIQIIQKFTK